MDELVYVIPTNIARFRVRYLLGMTADNLVAGVMSLAFGGIIHRPLLGLLLMPLGVLATWKFESLGHRHIFAYLGRWLWARFRPQGFELPLVYPLRDVRVQLLLETEEGEEELYVLERDHF